MWTGVSVASEDMYATMFLVFIAVYITIYLIVKSLKDHRRRPKPPGPWGYPVLGHLPMFGNNLPETFGKWRKKYGDLFHIRMGFWETIVINGYSAIKEACEKCDDVFSSRPDFLTARLLVSERNGGESSLSFGKFNPAYVRHRKMVASALRIFTKTKMNETQEIVLNEANKMIEEFRSWNNKPNYVNKVLRKAAGNIIYQVVYKRGENAARNDERFKRLLEGHDEMITFSDIGDPIDVMPWLRFFMPWKVRPFVKFLKQEESVWQHIVEQHKSIRKTSPDTVTDVFLDTDLPKEVTDKHNCLSKTRLLRSLNDLVGGGDDNTHALLSWLFLYMIVYPDIQDRVQREIDNTIENGCCVDIDDHSRLNYTWATILEVMRITSNVPLSLPHSTVKDTNFRGFRIDKETVVLMNLRSIHMDADFWKDPEAFRPERFLDKDNQILKEMTHHVVPFGLGRRRCVAEKLAKIEMFLLFTTLLQRCSFRKAENDILCTDPIRGLLYHPKPFRAVISERS